MNNQDSSSTFAVILAGGGGTRLWPKSRNKTPKQFLKLAGKKTMFQVTVDRVSKLVPTSNIIVVTNSIYEKEIKAQAPEIPKFNIILEPEKKDTALAMLIGALYAKSIDRKAVVINAASDHLIANDTEYGRVMSDAVSEAANFNHLIAVGITPTYASSAFGYIRAGDHLKNLSKKISLFKVDNFTEKPNKATARAFLSTGRYFWNANMYVWSSQNLQNAFAQHKPDLFELTKNLENLSPEKFHQALPEIYSKAEAISIDYAISEKVDNLTLIPGDFGWNDIGEWKVVYDLGKKDLAGNVIIGEHEKIHSLTINSQDNLIHTNGRLVALLGVDDMIVVDTDEILMICPMNKSQEVKKLVSRLKDEDKQEYL